LCSKIRNHRLRDCFERHSEFRTAGNRLTLLSHLKSTRLSL
jgi:hypothetical protein